MSSILNSVKNFLPIPTSDTVFDPILIMHTNSVFAVLQDMGIGPEEGFSIESASDDWDDYTTDVSMNFIKSYVCAKVKLAFDPPQNGTVLESLQELCKEYETRAFYKANYGSTT